MFTFRAETLRSITTGLIRVSLALCIGSFLDVRTALPQSPAKSTKNNPSKTDAGNTRRTPPRGEKTEKAETTGPSDYTSKNFLMHTDLSADEAKETLVRLETMLSIISRYWGRPNRQTIEMYVVKDLKKWPQGAIDGRGLRSIETGAGVTLSTVTSIAGQPVAASSVVYAVADRGTPQHEAVHAYCVLNFGGTGPVWYSEGMAEMGQYWRDGDKAVGCHEIVSDYLRDSTPKSLNEIVNGEETTGDSWQNYAWRWALCHLLATNENYAARFRPLGLDILMKKGATFEGVYGAMAKEISFEYKFFLKHVEPGFRCDLCSWDWKAKSRLAKGSVAVTATVEAARGWQPSRALVSKGEEYQFSASGTWKLTKSGEPIDADGDESGAGRLEACLFNDYELSEPFELGAFGKFTAPSDGQLMIRCQDKWTEIADNSGKLTFKIQAGGSGRSLPDPRPSRAGGEK